MSEMNLMISEEDQEVAGQLARGMLEAFDQVPTVCVVAAIISVTGSMCYNNAEGKLEEALKRADSIAASVKYVIDKINQSAKGNGDDE